MRIVRVYSPGVVENSEGIPIFLGIIFGCAGGSERIIGEGLG